MDKLFYHISHESLGRLTRVLIIKDEHTDVDKRLIDYLLDKVAI